VKSAEGVSASRISGCLWISSQRLTSVADGWRLGEPARFFSVCTRTVLWLSTLGRQLESACHSRSKITAL